MSNVTIGAYRTGDNEFMDLHSQTTIDFLNANYPAVMAQSYDQKLSAEYQFLSTFEVATQLQDRFGLRLVYASQQKSSRRDPNFQEHVLRFQFPDTGPVQLKNVGDSHPELVLANSHNGRSAIKFYAGIFRLVCSNGMVVADQDFGRIRVRHFGNEALGKFKALMDDTSRRMAVLDARIKKMQGLILKPGEQATLARMMMEARSAPGWLEPAMVLEARRPQDEGTSEGNRSMWTTFNVLQENLSNQHLEFRPEGGRPGFMRPISGSMRDLKLNEGLWLKLEEFIEARFPEVAGEIVEGEPVEQFVPEAEDQDSVPVAPAMRSFDELMALTYDEMVNVSVPEYEALSPEQRKKYASKKSYLKRKAGEVVTA